MTKYNELLKMLPPIGFAIAWEHPLVLPWKCTSIHIHAAANHNNILIIHDGDTWHDMRKHDESTNHIVKSIKSNLWTSTSKRL